MSGGGHLLFGALPDQLLNHVLSFLPSREAVQSSLLARRWRHLWRSTPAICVRGGRDRDEFRLFVNSLIIHRDATPLRSFEIDADLLVPPEPPYNDPNFDSDWRGEVDRHVDLWVTHALSAKCRARSLVVRLEEELAPWRPRSPLPFASPNLTTLHLDEVRLADGQLDFSCCPALLRLAVERCYLDGDALVSPSLVHLAIVDCHTKRGAFDLEWPDERMYIGISTPRLRFLEISDNYDWKQLLHTMPWLTEDNIQSADQYDMCTRKHLWLLGASIPSTLKVQLSLFLKKS